MFIIVCSSYKMLWNSWGKTTHLRHPRVFGQFQNINNLYTSSTQGDVGVFCATGKLGNGLYKICFL